MGNRGRPSTASLAIAARALEKVERQRPPHDLTDEEVEIWAAVVESQPADWFTPATVPLVAEYCRHVISARRIGQLIERATGDEKLAIKDYDRLLRMAARESLILSTLATKMRIAPQSLTNHRGHPKGPGASRKPWEG
jgi:hypothetical protein